MKPERAVGGARPTDAVSVAPAAVVGVSWIMRRVALIGVGVLALLVLAAVAVRESLRQGPLRSAVEARLSEALGQPVTIGAIGVAFLPRLALTGRDVQVGGASERAPALGIRRIRILPRASALWSGRADIEEVQVDGLRVSVLRDDEGGWHVPAAVPAPTGGSDDGRVAIERVRLVDGQVVVFDGDLGGALRESGSIDGIRALVTVEEGGLTLADITARIGGARIGGEARTDASAVRLRFVADAIEDADLPQWLRLAGSERPDVLRLTAPASVSADLRVDRTTRRFTGGGHVSAPRVTLDSLRLDAIDAPFALEGARVTFEPARFALYGGAHEGTVEIDVGRGARGWTLESRVQDLDVAALLAALSGRDQRVEGRANVTATLGGRLDEALGRTLTGRARLAVTHGVLRDFPLVAAVNQALRLAEPAGPDTRFERLAGTFAIAGARASTSDLELHAGHVTVQAEGTIGFDRSLALRGTAAISAARAAEAVASVRELARLRQPGGQIQIPLVISGTADAPSFTLDVRAAIEKGLADELKRRLRTIFKRPGGGS